MKTSLISMFATANDTDQWALCVDGHFGLFDKAQAHQLYAQHFNGNIEDTGHECVQLLPPGYVPIDRFTGQPMTESVLSQCQPIDMIRYLTIHRCRPVSWAWKTARQRLQEAREWAYFLEQPVNLVDAKLTW